MHGAQAEISREVMWNINPPGFPIAQVILYVLVVAMILLFLRGLAKGGFFTRFRMMRLATGSELKRLVAYRLHAGRHLQPPQDPA